jgi:hypothetical protein
MSRVLPILFNAEMVRAILEGRKSCTRKIVKSQQLIGMLPDKCKNGAPEKFLKEKKLMFKPYCDMTDIELINTAYKAPYQPGDILYVRETWKKAPNGYYYYEDWQRNDIADVTKWKPSIHMPKEAARIWLKVTDVRVERLQGITIDSIRNEGLSSMAVHAGDMEITMEEWKNLWNSTIKKSDLDSYGWNANPWVWVIEFERCEKPET